jgi:hypothetical protein
MSQPDPPPPQPTPWDLFGAYMANVAAVTSTIASRNLTLWRTPQGRLDDPERWRKDYERLMEVTTENARDVWSLSLGMTPSERVAYPLAAVELAFERFQGDAGPGGWKLSDQVLIPVGLAGLGPLSEHAQIELSGADPAGAAALRRCLRVRLDANRTGYLVESYDVRDLWPGVYTGLVYVDEPTRCPIAQLRVVVGGKAGEPTVPTVVLRWGAPWTPDGAPAATRAEWRPSPIVLRAPQGGPTPPQEIRVVLAGASHLEKHLQVRPTAAGDAYELRALEPPRPDTGGYYTGAAYTIESEPRMLAKLEVIIDWPGADPGE